MASGINKFLNFLKLTDEEDEFDDDFYDDEYDYQDQKELEKEEKRITKERQKEERKTSPMSRDRDDYMDRSQPVQPKRSVAHSSSSSKVVQMPTSMNDMEVCIVKPANIGEAQQVCDILLNSHPVVVNLEGIDIMEAQRIMDFISGCIFAIQGNMCQVSRYIFIFSPKDVEISGDYIKSLENEEAYNIATFKKEF